MARRIEDEFGHVQQLILIGKERGYLLYDEINDSLPVDVHSSQEIDDLMSILERQGIEIHEDLATANAARGAANATRAYGEHESHSLLYMDFTPVVSAV